MSQRKWLYQFNLRIKNMRESLGLDTKCYRCGNEVKLGDEIFSRNANSSKSKSKIYHKQCAEAVNII